jgi:hypothetical protein
MSRLKGLARDVLARAGWIGRPPERTVLLLAPDAAACDLAKPFVDALRRRYGRLCFAFLARDGAEERVLRERFPGDLVLARPWRNPLSSLLFLLTSRARMIVAMRGVGYFDRPLVRRVYFLGLPLVVLDAVPAAEDPASARRHAEDRWSMTRVDWYEPRHAAAAAQLRLRGVPGERIGAPAAASGDEGARAARVVESLVPLIARRPPVRRVLQRAVLAALDRPLTRRALKLRVRRIETLEEFRRELGDPGTILCLGSGPSSEMPELRRLAYDSLFRVNHRWLKRGFLNKPDVVFTGHKRTLFTVKGPILAFQTRQAEAQLVTHQVFNPFCPRMRYVTLERFGLLTGLDWDGLRPTNGAAMLAAAVALAPRRLIVGGIDLFQHPQGSYPGDAVTANAYVPAHDAALERKFILETLDSYGGDLVLVGDILKRCWDEHRRNVEAEPSGRQPRAGPL